MESNSRLHCTSQRENESQQAFQLGETSDDMQGVRYAIKRLETVWKGLEGLQDDDNLEQKEIDDFF